MIHPDKSCNLVLDLLTANLLIKLQGWMGPNYSISTACATSNFCILNAANHIIRGEAVSVCHGSVGVSYYFSLYGVQPWKE
jgi:3-oxoacyl-(acyl-carrier-protein) synthase